MKAFLAQLACLALAFAFAKGSVITANEGPIDVLRFPHYYRQKQAIECGSVITTDKQQIIYKPFEEVENNERCVWILAVPTAVQYRLRVSAVGFEPEAELLNVAELNLGPVELANGPLALNFTWEIHNAPVLMITFHSPSNATGIRGFALAFEVLGYGENISPHSAHQIVGQDAVNIEFPVNRTEYDNNELATFIFPPMDNANIGISARLLVYHLISFGQSVTCGDKVSIYYFDPATRLYRLGGSLCSDVTTELITLTDLAVFVFRSDVMGTGSGFKLNMANCGVREEE